ncbi:Bromo adjacent homology domain-containing 1 protein [Halotydeus destructor]|nr:Bromo adjacent homology domain-containing 1 protein [Halotydeus destructor]
MKKTNVTKVAHVSGPAKRRQSREGSKERGRTLSSVKSNPSRRPQLRAASVSSSLVTRKMLRSESEGKPRVDVASQKTMTASKSKTALKSIRNVISSSGKTEIREHKKQKEPAEKAKGKVSPQMAVGSKLPKGAKKVSLPESNISKVQSVAKPAKRLNRSASAGRSLEMTKYGEKTPNTVTPQRITRRQSLNQPLIDVELRDIDTQRQNLNDNSEKASGSAYSKLKSSMESIASRTRHHSSRSKDAESLERRVSDSISGRPVKETTTKGTESKNKETPKTTLKAACKSSAKNKKKKNIVQKAKATSEKGRTVSEVLNRPRKPRVASLNAKCKVQMHYEGEQEKVARDTKTDPREMKREKEVKGTRTRGDQGQGKKKAPERNQGRNQLAVIVPRKRKELDDDVEIIDTRSCKRLASLNASAIMSACYSSEGRSSSPYTPRSRHKSGEPSLGGPDIRVIQETHVSERMEISRPNQTVTVCQSNQVVLSEKNDSETAEMIRQLRLGTVSGKIRERLLAMELMEKEASSESGKNGKRKKSDCRPSTQVTTTKVHVTKVQINTTQGSGKRKGQVEQSETGHKIQTILKKDFVQNYQFQNNSTRQSYCLQVQTSAVSSDPSVVSALQPPFSFTQNSPPLQSHGPAVMSIGHTGNFLPVVTPSANHLQLQPHPVYFPSQHLDHSSLVHLGHPQSAVYRQAPTVGPGRQLSLMNVGSYPPPNQYGSSAFNVPHFATHSAATPNQAAMPLQSNVYGNYAVPGSGGPSSGVGVTLFNPAYFQPAGPLIQPVETCLIHKPVPFHPSAYQGPVPKMPEPSSSLGSPFQQTNNNGPSTSSSLFVPGNRLTVQPQTVYHPSLATHTMLHIASPKPSTISHRPSPVHFSSLPLPQFGPSSVAVSNVQRSPRTPVVSCISKSIQCSVGDETLRPNTRQSPTVRSQARAGTPDQRKNRSVIAPDRQQQTIKPLTVATVRPQLARKSPKECNTSRLRTDSSKSKRNTMASSLNAKTDLRRIEVAIAQRSDPTRQMETPLSAIRRTVQTIQPSSVGHMHIPIVPVPQQQSCNTAVKKPTKRRFAHGWSWGSGKTIRKSVYISPEGAAVMKNCFSGIKHIEGDLIKIGDCVLLRSGPRKNDLPFVAKISSFWESEDGDMMMSLLWYYRPEQTDPGRKANQMAEEIFASKHRDINSVATIEDKCHVLTYNEYCRYRKRQKMKICQVTKSISDLIVPESREQYSRRSRLPSLSTSSDLIFCCRKVYDSRQKRTLKNPV